MGIVVKIALDFKVSGVQRNGSCQENYFSVWVLRYPEIPSRKMDVIEKMALDFKASGAQREEMNVLAKIALNFEISGVQTMSRKLV